MEVEKANVMKTNRRGHAGASHKQTAHDEDELLGTVEYQACNPSADQPKQYHRANSVSRLRLNADHRPNEIDI